MTKKTATMVVIACSLLPTTVWSQNFERYRPQTIPPAPIEEPDLHPDPDVVTGSDKQLLEQLDAVIVYDDENEVEPQESNKELVGIIDRTMRSSNIVHSAAFREVVRQSIGQPVSLRSLNQLSRDIVDLYRRNKRPIVDVLIPEQKITGGTVQIVVIESHVDRVMVEGGDYFEPLLLTKWIERTRSDGVIYEPWIENDLFWLNQNPFRRVGVDLRPGSLAGTTDVVFEVDDVMPIRGYFGYDDTGVQTLGRERLLAGFIYGNATGNDDTISYQYTTDSEFHRLHAHAATYTLPINRRWTFSTYGSWAGVDPMLGGGLGQDGDSWQVGTELRRHLLKNRLADESVVIGIDFKATDNNLEFGGLNVQNSEADLLQLRLGYQNILRDEYDQYSILRADMFVGPGGGFTSNSNATNFQTIRAGTSPDYIYGRLSYEEAINVGTRGQWQLVGRAVGQIASERLLFSETLGFGGYDTVRGYDQRTLSGDHGWQLNFEFGPHPIDFCHRGASGRLRVYTFTDLGDSYIQNPLPGEQSQEFLASVGVGMRMSIGQDVSLRFDYGHGLTNVPGVTNDRLHLGLVWQFGPRP